MLKNKKVVYFICDNKTFKGQVTHHVLANLKKRDLIKTDIIFDNEDTYKYTDKYENEYYFVSTSKPICYDYEKYLPLMNKYFKDFDMSAMVTWHEGASAPQKVLTVHSLGDVDSGIYDNANPLYMHNLIMGYERNRLKYNLNDYTVATEATHWSGCYMDNSKAPLLIEYPVPMVDIEIGSDQSSWDDESAINALTDTLFEVFHDNDLKIHNILCLGGMHFDPDFAIATKTIWNNNETYGVTHIIANQWLVTGDYTGTKGVEYLENAIKTIDGGIEAITYHDKTKGCYKDVARTLGEKYNIPVFKHQKLRTPEQIEWPEKEKNNE